MSLLTTQGNMTEPQYSSEEASESLFVRPRSHEATSGFHSAAQSSQQFAAHTIRPASKSSIVIGHWALLASMGRYEPYAGVGADYACDEGEIRCDSVNWAGYLTKEIGQVVSLTRCNHRPAMRIRKILGIAPFASPCPTLTLLRLEP